MAWGSQESARDGATPDTPVRWIEADGSGTVAIPHGNAMLHADFERAGPDLFVRMPEAIGEDIGVANYFTAGAAPADLVSDGGAKLLGGTVDKLAGPMAPGEVAQAGGDAVLGDPVGEVSQIRGTVIVTRADGTEEVLEAGSPIYQDDVIASGPDGALGIVFIDNSSMSMASNARMVVDSMVFDSAGGQGEQVFDLIQGAFAFASGQIGANSPDNVTVRSPVATIGIRGTRFAVNVDQIDAETTVTLFEGAVVVQNAAGEQVLTTVGDSTVVSTLTTPPSPIFQMDAATQQLIYGDALLFLSDQADQQRDQNNDDDRDGQGQNQDGDDDPDQEASLDLRELEAIAAGLDDLETAAGPSGILAGTSGAISDFVSLLDQSNRSGLSGNGALANEGFSARQPGFSGGADNPPVSVGSGGSVSQPPSGSLRDISGGFGGSSFREVSFGSGLSGSVTGNVGGFDTFAINARSYASQSNWSVTDDGSGRVLLVESSSGSQLYLDEIENLDIATGSNSDAITLGDLTNTDIADETVYMHLGDGNDTGDATEAGKRLVAYGEGGDDTLIGSDVADSLYGGDGNDTLIGNGSSNYENLLDGGAGDDLFIVNHGEGDAGDHIVGGEGNDMLRLVLNQAALSDPVVVAALLSLVDAIANPPDSGLIEIEGLRLTLSGIESVELRDEAGALIDIEALRPDPDPDPEPEPEPEPEPDPDPDPPVLSGLVGTDDDDVLVDDRNLNEIHGLDGDDLILAGNGADMVYGGAGDDTIYGGNGGDGLIGGAGDDTIYGESGADVVLIDDGHDYVNLGSGADFAAVDLRDSAVIDATIIGGRGDDTVRFMLDSDFADRLDALKADLSAAKDAIESGDIRAVRLDSFGVTIQDVEHLELQIEGQDNVLSIDDVLGAENWNDLFGAGMSTSGTVSMAQEDTLATLMTNTGLPPISPIEPVE